MEGGEEKTGYGALHGLGSCYYGWLAMFDEGDVNGLFGGPMKVGLLAVMLRLDWGVPIGL